MTLTAPSLDDLTWAELTTAIRGRIAPASRGVWTHHHPVDPGVTLIEMFSWLLEQRIFWLDQVPDTLVRAALALLGQETLPTRAAGTVLRFASPATNGMVLAAGLEMRLARRDSSVVFTTRDDFALLSIESIALFSGDRDRTAELDQGRQPELFAAGVETARVVFHLSEPLSGIALSAPLGVLVELVTGTGIEPEWSPDSVPDVPMPVMLEWSYVNTSGGSTLLSGVRDGTGGLRRSGIVRIPIPADWGADGPADPATGLTAYSLTIRVVASTCTAPPRIDALAVNAVSAVHRRESRTHELPLTDWLPLPGRRIPTADLPSAEPLKDHPPFEDDVRLSLLERDGQWHDWLPVPDLSIHGPEGRVFRVDRLRGDLLFGDGLTGRVPTLASGSSPRARLSYGVGGGGQGNLGRNLSWVARTAGDYTAINPVAAIGGAEPESLATARARLVELLNGASRAVTEPDYVRIAVESPGIDIARAHVAIGYHPCAPCSPIPGSATVFVVPRAPRPSGEYDAETFTYVAAPLPDEGALDLIRQRMNEARLLGTEIHVVPVSYRAVGLQVDVESDNGDLESLRDRMTRHMRAVLDPIGGFEGSGSEGWAFGEPLRPSVLRHEAEEALEGRGEVLQVLIGLDGESPTEGCQDVEIGPNDLVYLDRLELRVTASRRRAGGLR